MLQDLNVETYVTNAIKLLQKQIKELQAEVKILKKTKK
jgi:hypothetical protein